MSKIHEASEVALLPQLNLWTVPPTQTSVDRDIEFELRPTATFNSTTPLKFDHKCPTDEYIMLNESHLNIRMKVTLKSSDSKAFPINRAAWDKVFPVNNLMHSIFSSCSIQINNRQVARAAQNYPYRAFFESFLAFAPTAKSGHLQSVLYEEDDTKRRNLMLQGLHSNNDHCIVDLEGMLHTDLTFQEKAIIGGSQMTFEFVPNDPSFFFKVTDAAYTVTVEFQDASLFVHRMKVSPELLRAHKIALERAPARYPITRTEIHNMTIQKGVFEALLDNVTTGQLPRRIFFGLVHHEAFSGSLSTDPFKFENFDLNHVSCFVGGTQFPALPYNPDFSNNKDTREFRALYRALNQIGTDTYLTLSKQEWRSSKCLFGFNFCPDLSNGAGGSEHVNLKDHGPLRINLKFRKELPQPVVLVLFAEFDNCIEIDSLGNVITDY